MADTEVTSSSRLLYYTDLHYIPEAQKNELWAAQVLIFNKRNCGPIVDADQVKKFRDIDLGKINEQALKEVFDPKDGNEGGTADFVATDWKSNPIYLHLSNITEANLEKIPINIYCKAVDEYAKLKQQKDNDKIIMRRYYLNFINSMNVELGYPLLKNTDDPYKYMQNMQPKVNGKKVVADSPMGLTDNIKQMINDSEDLSLYNELIYKGDAEIAIELGIQHYLVENKWSRIAEGIITDIRHHNICTLRWYTDLETGRPVIEYIDLAELLVTPFKRNDGEDITAWIHEQNITFRDFVRKIGKDLDKNQLKRVFELNKSKGAAHNLDFEQCSHAARDNARIRVAYHEFLTQNCDVYSEAIIKGNAGFKKMDFNWQPSAKTINKYKSKRVEKHYNVWMGHWYIPISQSDDSRLSESDFTAQAEFIFDLHKIQDQQRYGNDRALSRPSLVIWRNKRMSFAKVMDRFIPKIDFLWQQFQNNIANAIPNGLLFAEELLQQMVSTADDSAKNGTDSKKDFMKKLKQTGYGTAKMMTSDSKVINEGKPFVEIRTQHLQSAKEQLMLMMDLYNMCRQSLGIDPVGEGVAPKPRQSLGGIQLALDAGTSANWNMEKGYMDVVIEVGNRLLCYIISIINQGDSQRLQEFKDVVGAANGMALEAIKDIPNHKLGLSIENVNTDEAKARLVDMTEKLATAGMIDIEALYLINKIDNYKYAVVLMIMKYKQKQAQLADAKTLEFNRQVQLRNLDIQFKQQDYMSRADAESVLLSLSKKWDEKIGVELANIKSMSQQKLKEITGDNKIEQDKTKDQLHETAKSKEAILNTT